MKAIDCETKEVSYYNSMYAIQQHLSINAGIVKMVCEKINSCKTGISKKDNHHYEFGKWKHHTCSQTSSLYRK